MLWAKLIRSSAQIETDRWRRLLTWVLGSALLTVLFYFFGLHFLWDNADTDRGLLQGLDMARGNVLLNHWYSGSDSYWTIDSVFFAIGVLLIGAIVILLHVVSALVWAGVVVSGVYVATLGLRRWSTVAGAATVVVILGFPCVLLASFLAPSALHVATALFALIGFIGLRNGRFGWGWIVAVVVFAAGTLGDPLIVAYGLVPAFLVGVLDSVRNRRWTKGLATCSAPWVALVVAWITRVIAVHLGTYQITGTTPIAPRWLVLPNLRLLFENSISLFGLGTSLSTSGVPWELELFRSVVLVAVASGIAVGAACLLLGVLNGRPRIELRGMVGRSEASFRLSDLLILASLGDAVTYVSLSVDATGVRYLTAGVIFESILAAMLMGQLANSLRSRRAKRMVTIVGLVVAGICASSVGVAMSQPAPTSPSAQLGRFLAARHLYRGVGDYWSSASTTVFSNEVVKVRQVVESPFGGLVPYRWISKSDWYSGTFQFLVYNAAIPAGQSIRQAVQFPFAPVARTYVDHQFHIVVWKKPEPMRGLNAVPNPSAPPLRRAHAGL